MKKWEWIIAEGDLYLITEEGHKALET